MMMNTKQSTWWEDDKDNDGDCFGDSKSVLERAADACILPLVDVKRNRELVWSRKDFGTKSGCGSPIP